MGGEACATMTKTEISNTDLCEALDTLRHQVLALCAEADQTVQLDSDRNRIALAATVRAVRRTLVTLEQIVAGKPTCCPTCHSWDPELHPMPIVQGGGKMQRCSDSWHERKANAMDNWDAGVWRGPQAATPLEFAKLLDNMGAEAIGAEKTWPDEHPDTPTGAAFMLGAAAMWQAECAFRLAHVLHTHELPDTD